MTKQAASQLAAARYLAAEAIARANYVINIASNVNSNTNTKAK